MLTIECATTVNGKTTTTVMDAPNFQNSAKALEWAKLQWRMLRWPAYKVSNKTISMAGVSNVNIEIGTDETRGLGLAKYKMSITGTAIK
jgi:hypothetical protein